MPAAASVETPREIASASPVPAQAIARRRPAWRVVTLCRSRAGTNAGGIVAAPSRVETGKSVARQDFLLAAGFEQQINYAERFTNASRNRNLRATEPFGVTPQMKKLRLVLSLAFAVPGWALLGGFARLDS